MVLSENNEKPLRFGLKFRADHTFWELRAVRLCEMDRDFTYSVLVISNNIPLNFNLIIGFGVLITSHFGIVSSEASPKFLEFGCGEATLRPSADGRIPYF